MRGRDAIPPLPGRALHLRLRPARRLMWVGAGWAALCGALAVGIPALTTASVVRLLITVILADAVLGAAWAALLPAERSAPGTRQQDGDDDAVPAVSLAPRAVRPAGSYVDRSTDGTFRSGSTSFSATFVAPVDKLVSGSTRLDAGLAQSIVRWRSALTAEYGPRVKEVGLAYGLALLVALWLGPAVAALVVLGLVLPLVVWFALGGYPLREGWTRALLEIGLAWALGTAAISPYAFNSTPDFAAAIAVAARWVEHHLAVLSVGGLFTLAYYGMLILDRRPDAWSRSVLLNLPQLAAVVLLVMWGRPILAGTAGVLVLAQMLFQPYMRWGQARWYLAATQWLFMGVMLATALGLAGSLG